MKTEAHFMKRSTLSLAWATSDVNIEWMEMLPLSEARRNQISLQHHLQLVALRAGAGSLMSLQLLMRVASTSLFLERLGYGGALPRPLDDYQTMATQALKSGAEGCYHFDNTSFTAFAGLVDHNDKQLAIAPWKALNHVANELESRGRSV